MKRLREEHDSADPSKARAAAILSRLEPTPDSPARMRRIRRALERPKKRYALHLLRPAAVFGVAMGIAATAAAGYGVSEIVSRLTEQPRLLDPATNDSATPAAHQAPPSEHSDVRAREEPPAPIPESPLPTGTPEINAGKVRRDSSSAGAAAAPTSSNGAASEAEVVQQGLEALRKHNDPERAAIYLEQYIAKHPNGTLTEEALALSVEAASASEDPRAKDLAVAYLTRYPQGRFRQAARHALARALASEPLERKRHPKPPPPSKYPHRRTVP